MVTHPVEKCVTWQIGDGICDFVNNKEICNWDDLDCCDANGNKILCQDCSCHLDEITT